MGKKVNLVLDQGSTFSTSIELLNEFDEPLPVDNLFARGQIRKHYASNNYTSFSCSLVAGELTISLTAVQTANLEPQRHVYDVELVNSNANSVIRILEGFVTVTPEVTK